MIPVILKGETSNPIQLTLREGYVYSGCVLAVCFRGVTKTFTDLVAGGTVELLYTAEETSTFPLGTGKVGLSIQNSAGDICFMPWAKIKVTDSPDEVHDAQITIDPATLNVSDATSKDSLGAVKSKLNAVLAFLRGMSCFALLALPFGALADVTPLVALLDEIPGDTPLMTNAAAYVDAKITAATNGIPAPDFSQNNAQLRETIAAVSPSADLTEATNHTGAALSAFASTGTVANAENATLAQYATSASEAMSATWATRISDGGSVGADNLTYSDILGAFAASSNYTDTATNAMASTFLPRSHSDGQDTATVGFDYGPGGLAFVPSEIYTQTTYLHHGYIVTDDEQGPLGNIGQYGGNFITARQEVENTIREKSLGGIWDAELEVWWTPVMRGGALTYQATTNVNLNAEN